MASINLSGVLRDPLGEVSYGNHVRFTHVTVTGETISGFRSQETIVIDGEYDFDLQYGNVHIETKDKLNYKWISHGTFTVNSDTPAESLPALLGITTPATDADLLVFQALVADAETAVDEAEAAQVGSEVALASTEELFDSFDDSVAGALANVSPANIDWDLVIPFNDGARIEKGYGTFDTITVSSTDYDLPTRSVDVSRASSVWGLNKSGIPTEFAEDELIIDSNGAAIFEGYTNQFGYGMDSSDEWGASGLTLSDTTLLDAAFIELKEDSTTGQHVSTYGGSNTTISDGDVCLLQYLIHKDSERNVRLRIGSGEGQLAASTLDIETGDVTLGDGAYLLEDLGDVYAFSVYGTATEDSTISGTGIYMVDGTATSYEGDGSSSAYVTQRMFVLNSSLVANLPYVDTPDSSAATKGGDIPSFPINGNMPAFGEAYAIIFDFKTPVNESQQGYLLDTRTTSSSDALRIFRVTNSENVAVVVPASSGTARVIYASVESDAKVRFILAYVPSVGFTVYIDGVKEVQNTTEPSDSGVFDYAGDAYLGVYNLGTLQANGYMKNFGIYQGEVDDSMAAALGSAE